MKNNGQKSLTLSIWRKPLNLWSRKRPKKQKKKKNERRDWERNRRERQKECLKKLYLIPICFWKSKFDRLRGIGQESNFTWKQAQLIKRDRARIEGTRDFELKKKNCFSSSHFDQLKNRLDQSNSKGTKIWKILEIFFCRIIWKTIFIIWHVCSWLQMMFKTKLFKEKFKLNQISSIFSFHTPQNALNTSWSFILEGHKT